MTHSDEQTSDEFVRPGVGRGIRVLAWINVATVLVSVISFALQLDVLALMFPQAAVFFPLAWELDAYYGQVGLWFVFMGVAVLTAGIAALTAPRGHRAARVLRAVTVCGFVVACVPVVVMGGLAVMSQVF